MLIALGILVAAALIAGGFTYGAYRLYQMDRALQN